MIGRTVLVLFGCLLPLGAQTAVDRLVERIGECADRQEWHLGLETRVLAAERLRVIAPQAARKLLRDGVARLAAARQPAGYVSYRLLAQYAALDLDAAADAFPTLPHDSWSYTALIEQATNQSDFDRAIRWTRSARNEGQYSLSFVAHLLDVLSHDDPPKAATLAKELVDAFPRNPSLDDVWSLLWYVTSARATGLYREAARTAIAALDRPQVRDMRPDLNDTGAFVVGGRTIETKTSHETALLPVAAFLRVYDPEAYRARAERLPEWSSALAAITEADLVGLVKARRVMKQKARSRPPSAADFELTDKWRTARVPGLAREEQEAAYRDALNALAAASPRLRYDLAGGMFRDIVAAHLDALIPYAAEQRLASIDTAAQSDDFVLTNYRDQGQLSRAYGELTSFSLPQPNASIDAQRLLREVAALKLAVEDFTLPDQDGRPVALHDLRGKVVVLDFWATWCAPCRKAIPEVIALDREWSSKGVVVLGVDDETADIVRAYAEKNGVRYPTLIDRGRRIHDLFGVEGIPAVVVIGRDGTLVDRLSPPHNAETFRRALQSAGVK
jgi:peroxiredoxin